MDSFFQKCGLTDLDSLIPKMSNVKLGLLLLVLLCEKAP